MLDRLCDLHELKKHADLFVAIGEKSIILGDTDLDELHGRHKHRMDKDDNVSMWRRYVPFLNRNKASGEENANSRATEENKAGLIIVDKNLNKKKPIFIDEDNIKRYIFPDCCHVIPGDDAIGFIDNNNHIEIHNRACPVAAKLKASFGPRILDAKWDMHKVMYFDATIELQGIDRKGMLLDISKVISEQLGINMRNVTLKTDNGIVVGCIDMGVHDREDVKLIKKSLMKIEGMQNVLDIL